MEKKIVMVEVSGAQDIQAMVGCTVTAVTDEGKDNEGIILDCKDEAGNRVCFAISDDGSLHFYDSKKEGITVEQYGELAMLAGCSDIDSVHFNRVDPLTEIVIKPIGPNAADRVLTILRVVFPSLEVRESDWEFESETCPMYYCGDPNYYFIITVAVMPENIIKDIGGIQTPSSGCFKCLEI